MDRFPAIITVGGMLLGWIAGTMALTDPAVVQPDAWTWMFKLPQTPFMKYAMGIGGAVLVFAIGKWLGARNRTTATAA